MVRKLNELYKTSVVSCQGLSLRLQRFFLDKQRLLDRIQSVAAEKLIFSHAVQTVRQAGPTWGRTGRAGCGASRGGLMATAPPDFRGHHSRGGKFHYAVPSASKCHPGPSSPGGEPGAHLGFRLAVRLHGPGVSLPETQVSYLENGEPGFQGS